MVRVTKGHGVVVVCYAVSCLVLYCVYEFGIDQRYLMFSCSL